MTAKSQKPEGKENSLSLLNAAIEVITVAKDAANATPAQVAFSAAAVLLTMIRVSFFIFCEISKVDTQPGFYAE